MDSLIAVLHTIAVTAGFWGVVLVAFVQEIFPPLPSTVVSLSLGFLLLGGESLTAGAFKDLFFLIGLPIATGLTLGAVIIYYVVRWGGTAIIDRWGNWLGVTRADIDRLQARLKGRAADEALLFSLRCIPFVPSVAINVVAGLVRWNIVSFIILTFVGTIIRAMWSALIGWQIGSALEAYAVFIERLHTIIVVVVAIGIVGFIWYRRRTRKGAMDEYHTKGV